MLPGVLDYLDALSLRWHVANRPESCCQTVARISSRSLALPCRLAIALSEVWLRRVLVYIEADGRFPKEEVVVPSMPFKLDYGALRGQPTRATGTVRSPPALLGGSLPAKACVKSRMRIATKGRLQCALTF